MPRINRTTLWNQHKANILEVLESSPFDANDALWDVLVAHEIERCPVCGIFHHNQQHKADCDLKHSGPLPAADVKRILQQQSLVRIGQRAGRLRFVERWPAAEFLNPGDLEWAQRPADVCAQVEETAEIAYSQMFGDREANQ